MLFDATAFDFREQCFISSDKINQKYSLNQRNALNQPSITIKLIVIVSSIVLENNLLNKIS